MANIKYSPAELRLINLVLRRLGVDEKDPVAYELAVGYVKPFLKSDFSVNGIEKALRPIWPLYEKSVETISLALELVD